MTASYHGWSIASIFRHSKFSQTYISGNHGLGAISKTRSEAHERRMDIAARPASQHSQIQDQQGHATSLPEWLRRPNCGSVANMFLAKNLALSANASHSNERGSGEMSSHHPETRCAQRNTGCAVSLSFRLPGHRKTGCVSYVWVRYSSEEGGDVALFVRNQARRAASVLVVPAHRGGRKSALTFRALVATIKAYRRELFEVRLPALLLGVMIFRNESWR
jgi:hypothetical protein